MKRPLVLFTLIFCGGIIFADLFKPAFLPAYFVAVIVLAAGFWRFKDTAVSCLCIYCLIFLSGIILCINDKTPYGGNILKYSAKSYQEYTLIKGWIYSYPIYRNKKTEFILQAQEIQTPHPSPLPEGERGKGEGYRYNCCGKVMVYINGIRDFHCADELVVCGNLYRPWGVFAGYLERQGISAVINARTAVCLGQLSGDWQLTAKRFIFGLKERSQKTIYKYLSGKEAAVVEAMVLGEKRNIPRYLNNLMIKTGTVHILVVSGFNTGIIAFVIVMVMKLMRIPRRLRLCIAGLLLVLYCFITGASTPVVRATIMALLFLFSYFVKRETDIYNCCALAAVIILTISPLQLFDPGFQLSFTSVISIAYIYPRLKLFLRLDSLNFKPVRLILDAVLVSFSAWMGTLGFIAWYFKIISPVTALANIFIVPLASLITLCGLTLVICPMLAGCFSYAVKLIISGLFIINGFFANLPGAYFYFE